jgi:RHS repeat-associated protein
MAGDDKDRRQRTKHSRSSDPERALGADKEQKADSEGGSSHAGPVLPAPSLPKGGGAIASIGEKLVANPQMGTASFSVPVFTSRGRDGFGPALTVAYDAGAGNGPYGLGWALSVPNISRRTEKGLPRYDDAAESDTFVLSGAEDLVPIGSIDRNSERVVSYRPRVDSQFARIERHLRTDGTSYWVSWTRQNVRSVYGFSTAAQIARPGFAKQVFRWLLEWTDDDKGNCAAYVYKPEDAVGVAAAVHERGRERTNLYLKAIAYGNPQPRTSRDEPPVDVTAPRAEALATWPLIALFDYGEHDSETPTLQEGQWLARPDAFSSYRSGFEIRTHRLCRRVLMLHRFAELGGAHVVVRSTDFSYKETPTLTYLQSIAHVGWKAGNTGVYEKRSMPPVELGYGEIAGLSSRVRFLDEKSQQNLPEIDGRRYALVDYDGEGLPGILTEQAGRSWFYKRPDGRDDTGMGHFGAVRTLAPRPAAALAEGFQLQDINGDGVVDLVRLRATPAGAFERIDDDWLAFRPFPSLPRIDWSDPNLRFADLDGDGFPDLVITDQEVVRWHHALRRDGYDGEQRTPKPFDRNEPMPLFATEREAVLLADMTGDGLADIVHIENGSVGYWPNLGYGRFGNRVQMSGSPRLDTPDGFDPKRLKIGDIDGTGTTDLIYVARDGVHVYLNQSGNYLAAQPVIATLPPVDSLSDFTVADLWGTGTACLLWSTPIPGTHTRSLRWIDLLEGHKPHLLESIDNGLGQQTTLEHAPSTYFYLQDRAAGLPWITKLPFPVQTVAKVTVEDLVGATKLVTTYRYHHGFYDGLEREFRGFGMVEQTDTETLARFAGKGGYPAGLDATLHIDPKLTKTWFHTGAFIEEGSLSRQLADEYFAGVKATLPDSTVVGDVLPAERREASRALRGHVLRQEVYALDGNPNPFSVTENNYTIRLEHARGSAPYSVFTVHSRETLVHHVERKTDDPRMLHDVVLRIGPYGDVVESVSIGYSRLPVAARRPEQQRVWAKHSLHTTTPDHDALADDYRVGVAFENIASELIGLPQDHVLTFDEVVTAAAAPEQLWTRPELRTSPGRWLVGRSQVRYWDDDAAAELAPGQSGIRALASRTLALAMTRPFIDDVWQGRATGVDGLAQLGGYVVDGDLFWAFAGILHYDKNQFFLPTTLTNPFGGTTTIHYETPHLLLADSTTDAVGNQTSISNDYRLLSPRAITDASGTVERVETDALGLVVATSVHGVAGEGGNLSANDYSFYSGPGAPTVVHSAVVQEFGGATSEETWIYSDGVGREIQRKQRVEAGPLDPNDENSPLLDPRFVGTGRTIYDNKGNAVKRYEPYFSATSDFDTEALLVQQGVTPILHYDPLNRLFRTDLPNGTYSEIRFDAWSRETWDEIDTLDANSPWYSARANGTFPREPLLEQAAAVAALALAQTPTLEHLDPLGRVIAVVRDAGSTDPQRYHETSQQLDLDGGLLSMTDPRNLVVARQQLDVAGRQLFIDRIDGGRTWMLPDALGRPRYVWRAGAGELGAVRLRSEYDVAARFVGVWEQPDGSLVEILRERIVFRDGPSAPRYGAGRVLAELDGAGVAQYEYEFRGYATHATRNVIADPVSTPDWSAYASWNGAAPLPPLVQSEQFSLTMVFDATGRETRREVTTGARSSGVVRQQYDRAGQTSSVDADLPNRANQTTFVDSIAYDAHGRRVAVVFGHGGSTRYTYDPLTFRVDTISTDKGNQTFQALVYAYDPLGHITAIRDDAQDTNYFRGNVVKPQRNYRYDALYRLRTANGREHLSQAAPDQRDVPDPLALPVADPNDLTKVVSYTEQYTFDASSNLQLVAHTGATNWNRDYSLDPGSNRLSKTTAFGFDSNYTYDRRGNMASMPHLASMVWDHGDRLVSCTRTRVGNGPDPSAATAVANPVYLAYDQRDGRVFKQARTTSGIKERVYFAGFEIYRERATPTTPPTLERETLHVTDGAHRIALVETRTAGRDTAPTQLVRYQHHDHLGSAVVEVDESAAPLSYEEFHPFGTSALYAGLGSKRYRYLGKERDDETGLDHLGARYYASWLGRFTASDPEGLSAGINGYTYAFDSPLMFSDPNGREPNAAEMIMSQLGASLKGPPDLLGDLPFDASKVGRSPSDKPELYAQVQAWANELKAGGIDPVKTIIDRATATYEAGLREYDAGVEKLITGTTFEKAARATQDRLGGSWFGEADRTARGYSKGEEMVREFRVGLERKARLAGGDVANQSWQVIKSAYAELTPRGAWARAIAYGIAIRLATLPGVSMGRSSLQEPEPQAAPPRGGGGGSGRPVHSKYADETPVYRGEQPPRLGEARPDPRAEGAHTRLRIDTVNNRVYQGREFDAAGKPVRDIDFTSPTYPSGRLRQDHAPAPHQHPYIPNPTGGSPSRGPGVPL